MQVITQIGAPIACPPFCVIPAVKSILCNHDWCVCVCLELRRAPPFREIISSRCCRGVWPFLCFCLCLCSISCLPLPLPFVFFCPCLCLCRASHTIHMLACFACIRFSFDDILSGVHRFHTMTVPLTVFDLDCPSPTSPSGKAGCSDAPYRHFRFLSQMFTILSCQQC